MGVKINVNLKPYLETLTLPLNNSNSLELKIMPINHVMSIEVSDFPSFGKIALSKNIGLVQSNIGLNILSQRLIVNADPLNIYNIDSILLEELDIDQNKTIYNI